jgi:ubiquinone/menaquinone biosynthesis C-methylase UbiE
MSGTQPEKDKYLQQQEHPCPPGCCFTFDNPFRRLIHNPYKILKPYINKGMTALDIGPGMGYFTIPMAKLVGEKGKVIAADLQAPMLEGIRRRALKAGVAERIKLHQTSTEKIGISEAVDFCLAFWMVHEVVNRQDFIEQIASVLKPSGLLLIVEPKIHVAQQSFDATIDLAKKSGLTLIEEPKVFISRAGLLKK